MTSHLLNYLPEIYHTDDFSNFLLAFERVLLGHKEAKYCYINNRLVIANARENESKNCYAGLEQTIANLAHYFHPAQTPDDFLSWLASWTALSIRADLDKSKQREFIARIVPKYRFRGTKTNLQSLLEIFLVSSPTIIEMEEDHKFSVRINLPADPSVLRRQLDIAINIIELEKPAHTDYQLDFRFPTMRVGDPNKPDEPGSRLGIDTLLGTIPNE